MWDEAASTLEPVGLLKQARCVQHGRTPQRGPTQSFVQVLHDTLAQHTAQGAATGEAVATFESVGLLAPRGRFEVEMFVSSMTLSGQVGCPSHLVAVCCMTCASRSCQCGALGPLASTGRSKVGCVSRMHAAMTIISQVRSSIWPACGQAVQPCQAPARTALALVCMHAL